MGFQEFIEDNGQIWFYLFSAVAALAIMFGIINETRVDSSQYDHVLPSCPKETVKVEVQKTCDITLLNDCLRIYRGVDKLSECAQNKYCTGLP